MGKLIKQKNALESIADDIRFEMQFYAHLAGSENFEVVPVGGSDGYDLDGEDFEALEEKAKELDIVLLYRINVGATSIVVNPNSDKIGIVPEDNPDGFYC